MKTNYFKKLSLLTSFIFLMGFSAFACNYTVSLTDSYGDGWNGNSLTVKVNGVAVITNLTLSTGSGPLDSTFAVTTGDTIDVIYNGTGSYKSENGYQIKDALGTVVVNKPNGSSSGPGNVSNLIAACPVNLDAGMFEIIPSGTIAGTQTIKGVIKNYGLNTLTSATINWSIDGSSQTAVSYTGSLANNATDTVILGTYTFSVGSHIIVASTSSPNNGTDGNTANDTVAANFTFFGTIASFPFNENFTNGNSYFQLSDASNSGASLVSTGGNPGAHLLLTGGSYSSWSNYSTVTGAFGNTTHVSKATATINASNLSYLKMELDIRQLYTYNKNYNWARIMINDSVYVKDLNGDSVWQPSTATADPYQTLYFDLSAYAGTTFTLSIQLAAKYNAANYGAHGDDLHIDNIYLYEPPANDLSIFGMDTPKSGMDMSDSMDVALIVYNNGVASQTGYTVSYSLDSGATFVSQIVNNAITPGDYDTIYMTTTANLKAPGVYNFFLAVHNNGDTLTANDSAVYSVENIALPYQDGFESYATNSQPNYWSFINTTGTGSAYAKVSYSGFNSSNSYRLYNYNKTSGDLIGIMPVLYSDVSTKVLKFWVKGYNSGDLYVGVLTDPTDPATFTAVDTIAVPNAYAKFAVDFSSYTGTGHYVAFKHGMGGTYKSIYIDDINFYQPLPNEMMMLSWDAPKGAIELDTADIVISVYNNGTQAQDTIPVAYSIDGGTTIVWDTIYSSILPEDTLQFTFSTPAVFSPGLNECGAVVNNSDSVPQNDSVFAAVTSYPMPYTNGFENDANLTIPADWSVINTTGSTSPYVKVLDYGNYAYTGNKSLKFYNSYKTSGDLIGIMPKYSGDSLSTKWVNFWLRGHGTTTLIVGVLTSPTDPTTFVAIDTLHPVNNQYDRYAVDFSNYTGTGKYIGFKHGMESSYAQLFIDDLVFETKPADPIYAVSPDTMFSLPNVRYNFPDTVEQLVTITNNGVGQLSITTPTLGGVNDTNFAVIDTNTYPASLGTFESISFKVRFFGSSIGPRNAYLSLTQGGNNDTIFISGNVVDPVISTFPFVENFDDGMMDLGWHKTDGNYKWLINQGGTPSSYTGPLHDFSGNGYYIYTEASYGTSGAMASVITNPVNMTSLNGARMNFWYHMYGSDINKLVIEIAQNGTWTAVDSLIGQQQSAQTDPWMMRSVDLSAYASSMIDSVRFMAVRGGSYAGDISVDNIAFGANPVVSINDTSTCDSTLVLDATMAAGNYTYTWTDLSTNTIVSNMPTYTVTATGDYEIRVVDAGYFTGIDTVHVDMYSPAVPVMTPDTTICENDTVTLSAMVPVVGGGVFFSEYIEGSSNNKALEIYNGTGATINLDDYSIMTNYNGNPWSGQYHFPAGATLAAGDVFVIANENADPAILAVADDTLAYNAGGYVVGFNGDDVRALFHHTSATDSAMIDIIGAYDLVDPGAGWDVAGVSNATKDHSLIRKSSVTMGDTSWSAIAGTDSLTSQYLVYPKNYFGSIGSHTVTGGANVTYLWSNGDTTASINVAPTTTTTYTVMVDNGHCPAYDSVTVTVIPLPVVNLGNDTTIKWSWSLTLDAGNPNATWLWSTGATTQTETFDSLNLTNGTANTVWVAVTENGCSASDTLIITVLDDVSINGALSNIDMALYPNPTKGRFNMVIQGYNGSIRMDVVDLSGQVVHSEQIDVNGSYTGQFDMTKLASGAYYIKLSSKDGVKVVRLIIQ